MKTLLLALALTFSTAACSKETPKPAEPQKQEVKAEEKKPEAQPAEKKEVETKRVCIKVWDAAKQKEVEKCRTMKIHEKREGTKVPEKK